MRARSDHYMPASLLDSHWRRWSARHRRVGLRLEASEPPAALAQRRVIGWSGASNRHGERTRRHPPCPDPAPDGFAARAMTKGAAERPAHPGSPLLWHQAFAPLRQVPAHRQRGAVRVAHADCFDDRVMFLHHRTDHLRRA